MSARIFFKRPSNLFRASPRSTLSKQCKSPLSSGSRSLARKDTQGKDDMLIEPNEYSKSGSDTAAAQQDDAAFDPKTTSPEGAHDQAGSGRSTEGNPLDISPANIKVSQTQGTEKHGGAENSSASSDTTSDRERSSGGGSPQKGKAVS
ncbi:hypothetical protein MMC25_006823 [Agyrium rufum]|nr:hypothetical protein [Agyrium rufum]